MEYYDSHSHCIKGQKGGILIGMEGEPSFDGVMSNHDVELAAASNSFFVGAYYVDGSFPNLKDETVLKYHPRREHYQVDQVIEDLKKRHCKLCIVDTLNQPYWQPLDYWKLVAYFPKLSFILPHMGGYDVVDFLKILDFNPNVYADFSMTQEYFGWCGSRPRLAVVADCIDYCLSSKKLSKRVLFGSDEPFFSQHVACEKYAKLPNAKSVLIDNYINLMNNVF